MIGSYRSLNLEAFLRLGMRMLILTLVFRLDDEFAFVSVHLRLRVLRSC